MEDKNMEIIHIRSLKDDIKKYLIENKESFYRVAYSYTKNEQDALDIVQESIYKALCYIEDIENIKYIKQWFYKILVNTAIDNIRKNKKYVYENEEIKNNELMQWDKYVDLDLQTALNELPHSQRMIIILRFFEDMKISDIAIILNENVNTIKTRMYTALKRLKIKIEC